MAHSAAVPRTPLVSTPILLDLPQSEREQLGELADLEQRPTAQMARLLLQKGLAAAQQDHSALRYVQAAGPMSGRPIGLRLLPHELDAVKTGARREQRSVTAYARLLVLRGLADTAAVLAG